MDSVTQAVLGAAIGGAIAPAGQRRKALLVGAALGTLPDLDVVIDYGDPVANFTYHRGFSHSLLVLPPFALLLWLALRRWWAPVRDAPRRWLAIIGLALVTHPLLDAHTAYGTQLLWPLEFPPVMWATLFIIDPLFTLPMLVAVVIAAAWPGKRSSGTVIRACLLASTLYLGWSWTAQSIVAGHAREALAGRGLSGAPVFITPTPFNTLLWRVVALTEDGYLEGFDSLLVDEESLDFSAYRSDRQALLEADTVWAVSRLRWFSRDFVKASVVDDRLLITDLRMGQEPVYVFTHVVAARGNPHWEPMPTELISPTIDERVLLDAWRRMWTH
ncbi:MAG TPA: metal-dependent hydrolase [Woeseiaceae bacterium]|nr:metal-dependent hydrolase [Woeseiaceae bacterium]